MSTESDIKLARYNAREKESDTLNRVITVRRLRPSEQTRIAEYTANVTGADEVVGPNDTKMVIPHRLPLMLAAAVCQIDESPIPFPRNRAELDAIYDRLDEEGLAAAGRAVTRLQMGESLDPIGDAKNLSRTPSTGSSAGT
jgi:hypothetical protein